MKTEVVEDQGVDDDAAPEHEDHDPSEQGPPGRVVHAGPSSGLQGYLSSSLSRPSSSRSSSGSAGSTGCVGCVGSVGSTVSVVVVVVVSVSLMRRTVRPGLVGRLPGHAEHAREVLLANANSHLCRPPLDHVRIVRRALQAADAALRLVGEFVKYVEHHLPARALLGAC